MSLYCIRHILFMPLSLPLTSFVPSFTTFILTSNVLNPCPCYPSFTSLVLTLNILVPMSSLPLTVSFQSRFNIQGGSEPHLQKTSKSRNYAFGNLGSGARGLKTEMGLE